MAGARRLFWFGRGAVFFNIPQQQHHISGVVQIQPVIKLLQKGVRVHQKRVILMQKMLNFSED